MHLGLSGKKAILTGGSRGIGRAVVDLLADEGCDVSFISRNAEQTAETVQALRSRTGRSFDGVPLDMSNATAYRDWLTSAADKMGGCDIFIHNASASGSQATMDWQKCFEIDVLGAVSAIEVLGPHLEKSPSGSIILMSSTAAVETFLYPQAFNAMKAAAITYAKQLSQLLAPKGVRVNTVSPGPIAFKGGNWEHIMANMPDLYQATLAAIPSGRLGSPEEVAKAVVFLASPAANYITGVNLIVDGGFTKRVQF